MITTTLNAIQARRPCKKVWEKLLNHLGKTKADEEPLSFKTIFESNGFSDALWCLSSLGEQQRSRIQLMAADFAERVLPIYEKHYPEDMRPRQAIKAARDYANGLISNKELGAAKAAAYAAYACAARAAKAAASYAAFYAVSASYAAAAAVANADNASYAAANAAADAVYAANASAAECEIQAAILLQYFGDEE